MKKIYFILTALLAINTIAQAQTNFADLSREIIGAWQSGEKLIPHPPPELWKDITNITFHTNGIVEWSIEQNGKIVERSGRYMIQPNRESKRDLPLVFIAPANYPDPRMSSIVLLVLKEIEIDFDSRFSTEVYGKVLKATVLDGKSLLFIRKKDSANKAQEDTARKLAVGLKKDALWKHRGTNHGTV